MLGQARSETGQGRGTTLAAVTPGEQVRIDQLDGLPIWQRTQLVAYGLAPGRHVDVLQTKPVAIVRVDPWSWRSSPQSPARSRLSDPRALRFDEKTSGAAAPRPGLGICRDDGREDDG